AEGRKSKPERMDALVLRHDAAAWEMRKETSREEGERDADRGACGRLPEQLQCLVAGVPARRRQYEEEEHERQREPVVEAGLEVERVAHERGHAPGGDDRGSHDR